MKPASTSEIVSIADTFKLADDVLIPYRVGDKFGFCDKDKNIVIEPKYTMATPFSNGYAGVVIKPEDALHTVAGYINKKGEMVTGFDYTFITPFLENGRAVVRSLGGQYGVIDASGEYVIPAGYNLIEYRPEWDLYLARLDGKYGLIDEMGNIKFPIEYDVLLPEVQSGVMRVSKDKKWGAFDLDLNLILPVEYDYIVASPESNNIFYVEKNGDRYVINANQEKILDVKQYTRLVYVNERVAVTQISSGYFDATYGLLDIHSGKEILSCEYGPISSFEESFATLQIEEGATGKSKYGLINERGEFIITPEYDFMMIYDQDFIYAYKENSNQENTVFNFDGEVVYNSEFRTGSLGGMRKTGLFMYKDLDAEPDLHGVIDKKGKIVIDPIYEDLAYEGFDEQGVILVKRENMYFYIDLNGVEYVKK